MALDADMGFGDFKTAVMLKTGLAMREVSLFVGFPPTPANAEDPKTPISQLQPKPIKNGDSVVVEDAGEVGNVRGGRYECSVAGCSSLFVTPFRFKV